MNVALPSALRELAPGIDRIVAFDIPLTTRFRRVDRRRGLLLHGPAGWAEWSPFEDYDDTVAADWLESALADATHPAPAALRTHVPVNVTVPAVDADTAERLVRASGCVTAKVKVAEPGQTLDDDVARVAAVRRALGPYGRIRVDANGAWDVPAALVALAALEDAAGGLDYVEQPCASLRELAEVRQRAGVRVAADEAIRRDHTDPVLLADAVDLIVVKVQPSGGIHRVLQFVEDVGLPAIVSSALDTSIGLAQGVALAAALPQLDGACGLGTGLLLADDVVRADARLRPVDGMLDVAVAAACRVEGALRDDVPAPAQDDVERWRARLDAAVGILAGRAGGVPRSGSPSGTMARGAPERPASGGGA
jgi:o-succinylbenzoate synthase